MKFQSFDRARVAHTRSPASSPPPTRERATARAGGRRGPGHRVRSAWHFFLLVARLSYDHSPLFPPGFHSTSCRNRAPGGRHRPCDRTSPGGERVLRVPGRRRHHKALPHRVRPDDDVSVRDADAGQRARAPGGEPSPRGSQQATNNGALRRSNQRRPGYARWGPVPLPSASLSACPKDVGRVTHTHR